MIGWHYTISFNLRLSPAMTSFLRRGIQTKHSWASSLVVFCWERSHREFPLMLFVVAETKVVKEYLRWLSG